MFWWRMHHIHRSLFLHCVSRPTYWIFHTFHIALLPLQQNMSGFGANDDKPISVLECRKDSFYGEVDRGKRYGQEQRYSARLSLLQHSWCCLCHQGVVIWDWVPWNASVIWQKGYTQVDQDIRYHWYQWCRFNKSFHHKQQDCEPLDRSQNVAKYSNIFDVIRQIHEIEEGIIWSPRPFLNQFSQNMERGFDTGSIRSSWTSVQFGFMQGKGRRSRQDINQFWPEVWILGCS